MSTGELYNELKTKAAKLALRLYVDKSGDTWYAIVVTTSDGYENLVTRSFVGETLDEVLQRVRFPVRTPSGQAVYL